MHPWIYVYNRAAPGEAAVTTAAPEGRRPPTGSEAPHHREHPHRPSPRPGDTARVEADLPGLGAGGRAALPAQQPRPGGGRAPGRPGRVRRHGQGGAQLGVPRGDRGALRDLDRDRDADRPVGQAGRGAPDPRRCAARPDLERDARTGLVDAGGLLGARGGRPDHVRPDDGRGLVLHRHPGDPRLHLRDVQRGGQGATSAARWPGSAC